MAREHSKRWTNDELLLACGLYYTIPFGRMDSRNPRIIRIATNMGRTPGSVAMLLVNLASLDPEHQRRGVKGLGHPSNAARHMWAEFHRDRERMALQSEALLDAVDGPVQPALPQMPDPVVPTETEVFVSVRKVQSYFRRMILGIYEGRCCLTGLPVEELLVASHILPWAQFPQHRLDLGDGLCLAAQFDRAFDRGMISFDENNRLLVGSRLREYATDPIVSGEFLARAGQSLRSTEDAAPKPEYLAYHRANIFHG